MRQHRFLPACLTVLLLASCATTPRQPAPDLTARWLQQIVAISEGDTSPRRAAAIKQRLRALGLRFDEQPFRSGDKSGRNVIADTGGPAGAPLLLIGAHYDKVDVGRGATDNAAGVAAVLELAAAFQAQPLKSHRVQVAFWDLEEHGLLGAQAWVAAPGQQRPALYVNFDVFAWGDTLWMMTPASDGPLVSQITAAAGASQLALRTGASYPPTDHRAFLQAGWPAVSFSLLGADEIDPTLEVYAGRRPAVLPKVAQIIHSARDTIEAVDATHVPVALRTIEAALRAWDAQQP